MKRCTKCGEKFDVSFFCKDKSKPDGLHPWCKTCRVRNTSRWQKENRDKCRKNVLNHRLRNPELTRTLARKYYYSDPQKQRDRVKNYRFRNPEKVKSYKEYYKSLPDTKEKELKAEKKWREKNPHKTREYDLRRRSRKLALPNTLTEQEWQQILITFDSLCAYCKKKDKLVVEHLIPLSRIDILGNPGTAKENIVPSCRSCNSSKHNRTHYEWCSEEQLEYIYKKKEGVKS